MSEPETVRTPAELQLEGQRLSNAKLALGIARLSAPGMAESMAATAKMRYSDFSAAQFKYGGR